MEIKLSGASRAKGRNGEVALASVELLDLRKKGFAEPIVINGHSRRRDGEPPVRFMFTAADGLKFAELLLPLALDEYGGVIGELLDTTHAEEQAYFQNCDPREDYAGDWPAVLAGKIQKYERYAQMATTLGYWPGENSRWADLAAELRERYCKCGNPKNKDGLCAVCAALPVASVEGARPKAAACSYPTCTVPPVAICENCLNAFCPDHGTQGGDRQVQDVGAVAYPSTCWQHGGFNADE